MAWTRRQWLKQTRVKRAIAAILASGLGGCSSTADCSGEPRDFDSTFVVHDTLLDAFVAAKPNVTSWDEATCEEYCLWTGFIANSAEISSCSLSLPVTGTDGAQISPGEAKCVGKGSVICEGRRPLGHVDGEPCLTNVGAILAEMAAMEAASVRAFIELAEQLREHGAPETFITRCLSAADDERHHARLIGRLAIAYGGEIPALGDCPRPATLFEVALHNAVEGCVNETWAAMTARVRAQRASDADLQDAFQRVAKDEARHGQLAWDLHGWFQTQLPDAEALAVRRAQLEALKRLPAMARRQAEQLGGHIQGLTPAEAGPTAEKFASLLAA